MFFLSFAVNTQAQSEYTDGVLVFPDNAGLTPHDPKVSCHQNGDHCLLMFYDELSQTTKLKFSWAKGYHYQGLAFGCTGLDFFLGCSEVGTVSNDLMSSLERLPVTGEYHLPYDVSWVAEDNTYYLFIENVHYTYVPNGAFSVLRTESNFDWALQFINETTIFRLRTIQNGDVTNDYFLLDITDNTLEGSGKTASAGGCSGVASQTYPTENLIGFATESDGTLFYRIYYGYNSQNCTVQVLGTMPEASGLTGISYYVNSVMQYNLNSNETREAITIDFASYTSASTIYEWNESEFINSSMLDTISTNSLYVYERTNVTGSINGIYVYNEQLYPLQIVMGIQDLDRGGQFNDVNTSAGIGCTSENYTQFDTGGSLNAIDLSTPCLTGNTISIQTIDGLPDTFNFSYDVIPGCEDVTTYIFTPDFQGYIGFYNFTIRVRDSIFNTGVPGVTVLLSGESQTTDSDGNAFFEIAPILNSDFIYQTINESCTATLSIDGGERIYNILASKSGYNDYSENAVILGTSPFNMEAGDFTKERTIIMDQEGSKAEVHVYSSDGIELFPSVVEVEVFGSNNTYIDSFGELIESNISFSVPALFHLIDGRDSFPANFTLKYYYGDDFDYYQQNVTVFKDGFQEINFYINENFANLKCSNSVDCPQSVCSGLYYKQFSACSSGLCTYTSERCTSSNRCDPVRGCFDIQYTDSCTLDGECEDACLTNFSMVDKFCGSSGLCVGNTVECSTNCSIDDGFCSELLECLYPSTDKFRLVLPNTEADSFYQAVREDVTCDFDNAGESFCISQNVELLDSVGLLWATDSIDQVSTVPLDWKFIRNDANTGYNFYGISGACSDECELNFVYCQNGCDTESGLCVGVVAGEQNVASDWLGWAWIIVSGFVPDFLKTMVWSFVTIGMMLAYRYGIRKGHSGGDKDTLLVGFVTFLIGVSVAWIHWIFLVMIGFVIAYILWDKNVNKSG